MYISHDFRLIFVRTEKTAGTSIEVALRAALGDDSADGHGAARPRWARFSPVHHGALTRRLPELFGLHPHATARQIRRVLGKDIFDSYFTFAVDPNPWDRQVSLYYQRQRKRAAPVFEFDRHIRSRLYRATEYVRLNNWGIYADGDSIMVDRVLRYEEIETALPKLLFEIGVRERIDLPRARAGHRVPCRSYRDEYTPESRALIASWYPKEIEALGYCF
ncbi:hypothetical protein H0I76_05145 [Limibaculum sp. M0105]|uniref:Sulfotransferase family protein n=1 Tax=Thermohalobaculum xanthum TaxID=2753746 RepID=A0A8J7M574_9RHOB|nr:sulfotransferase family 2 domain-containing protein [Thermohalobaculum xanthum]MBK0398564.1 hypothetical protein [Thermohalobaculum xanthum]